MSETDAQAMAPRRAMPPKSNKIKIIGIVVAIAVLVAGTAFGVFKMLGAKQPAAETDGCSNSSPVTVDPAYSAAFQQLAKEFAAAKGQSCPSVKVQAVASSRVAVDGLRSAKAWIPEDVTWQQMASGQGAGLAQAKSQVVAKTPLVLVSPKPLRDVIKSPLVDLLLSDLLTAQQTFANFGKPEWGNFKLAIPDPQTSAAGALGFRTMALEISGGEIPSENPLKGSPAQRLMARVEQRVMKWSADATDVLNYLDANEADASAREKPSPRAGLTTEFAALAYQPDDKKPEIFADYVARGRVGVEIPVVIPEPDPNVQSFVDWLTGADGQKKLSQLGFRAGDCVPDDARLTKLGLRGFSYQNMSSAEDRKAGLEWWKKLHHRESVLMVVDLSGSMAKAVGEAGETKLDLVKNVVLQSWSVWPPGTANGLITFNTDDANNTVVDIPIPLQRDTSESWDKNRTAYEAKVKGLVPQGWTPLYEAIVKSYEHNKGNYQSGYRNRIIVLTDGTNEIPQGKPTISLDDMLGKLPKTPAKDDPITMTFVGVGDADMNILKRIADQTGGTAIAVKDPKELKEALEKLLYG